MLEGVHDHDEDIDEMFSATIENDDEAFDDEAFDDEAPARRRSQFIPRFRQPSRPVAPGSLRPIGSGVQTATLSTPRGSATLRLPEPVATKEMQVEQAQKFEASINTLASDINGVRSTLADLRAESARGQREVLMRQRKLARATKAGLQKTRRQQQMAVLLGAAAAALVQRENDKKFDEHIHSNTGTAPTVASNKNLPFLLLLPVLPSLLGGGEVLGMKTGGSEMTNLIIAGGLAFLILRSGGSNTATNS